jgi:hypothetical protein
MNPRRESRRAGGLTARLLAGGPHRQAKARERFAVESDRGARGDDLNGFAMVRLK